MSTLLWTPAEEYISQSQMTLFTRSIDQKYPLSDLSYSSLHQWSISYPHLFWQEVWKQNQVIHSVPYQEVMQVGKHLKDTRWFTGTKLNFAENVLRHDYPRTAIEWIREDGKESQLSFEQIRTQVAQCANALRSLGVVKGDRVAGILPNSPEAIIVSMATISLGAIWSSCSPDFGIDGILDRFAQIQPKVLISIDAYLYAQQPYDCLQKTEKILAHIPTIQQHIFLPYLNPHIRPTLAQSIVWEELLEGQSTELVFEQVSFDHPIYILYSSGTTGVPKSIVHGSGGTLLQHLKEHRYHVNLQAEDCVFYFTTCGWMMWNWLVSTLAQGVRIVLYDGSPLSPKISSLWEIIERKQITHFGTSPKFLSAIEKAGYRPSQDYALESLQSLLSTGAPLSQRLFHWSYQNIKSEMQLASISGGTDIISCFMLGNPNLPVYAGEIQCKGLGMDVCALNENGYPVVQSKGELVCRNSFPSMPVSFWNDPQEHNYHQAYFLKYPNQWTHGDYIEETENGGFLVYGRSDTTLNPGGVRIGTAEIYRIVEELPEILDSIVVGQPWQEDTRIILFVVLSSGQTLEENLQQKIRRAIRQGATPRHLPQKIIQIPEVPRTISGKKVEKAVLQILQGKDIENQSALANPLALEPFRQVDLTH